ncbi:bis(5'-nucleosyl)-tetraphosphatase (symmetrical) YqeK [Alicyclobacillus cycloheptanicus]|uniref:bis(5'-nucleosyl)-tetraphosphatase (symmetrical) n=1 Tax=Alicyclobacillus cycloheptanicus TaxID=1457 RepID=A0ABT9XL55_9BACL|nr:bis(5'-nucleosyl)-tetraphosphatase (symmetrical) YqeK [Alicyclobacillus cycloheptanicus]MDQ0190503.1 putative HD superfamily hydrolase involved in NAD metabolism [Alicyclobacillus cycloheptanicus]WDM00735.1 bis(5'-nucleosyl)-tetraphosphatase (symmetrical) YqeK [Alicyclobacillus cycloheptanicus]
MKEEEIRERVRQELSPARFAHVEGVVQTAAQLAERYGVDPARARTAAWLHDLAREWSVERLKHAAENIEIPSGFGLIPALLHGPIAASFAVEWYGVDEDVANAIRFHTTGRVGMSTLEKIICLADAIEPGRAYPGVEELRAAAQKSLDLALLKSFDATLRYLIDRQQPIFTLTVMARNEFLEKTREEAE